MFYSLIGININNYSGAIKKKGSSADYWWLRGEWVYSTDAFWSVTSSGVGYSLSDAYNTYGISPAFRVA